MAEIQKLLSPTAPALRLPSTGHGAAFSFVVKSCGRKELLEEKRNMH